MQSWHLDETFVTLLGEPYLWWRAIGEQAAEVDVLMPKRRDKAAAKRFFRHLLGFKPVPRKIVTDLLRSYPAAKADIPEPAHVKHVFVKATAHVNNLAENRHRPAHRRECQMCGFRDARRTQAFLSCFCPIRQHFALWRHQMNAACHRAALRNASSDEMVRLSLPHLRQLSNKDNYAYESLAEWLCCHGAV